MVGYFWNRPGVTWLTSLSVDCADRIVATSSSQGVVHQRADGIGIHFVQPAQNFVDARLALGGVSGPCDLVLARCFCGRGHEPGCHDTNSRASIKTAIGIGR